MELIVEREIDCITTVDELRAALKECPGDMPVGDAVGDPLLVVILRNAATGQREVEIR